MVGMILSALIAGALSIYVFIGVYKGITDGQAYNRGAPIKKSRHPKLDRGIITVQLFVACGFAVMSILVWMKVAR